MTLDNNTVDFKTSLFGLRISGPNALAVFLFLALLALTGLTFYEHIQREHEHQAIICAIKLNLFMYSIPKGSTIDWERMPVDLYPCVPRFLYEKKI